MDTMNNMHVKTVNGRRVATKSLLAALLVFAVRTIWILTDNTLNFPSDRIGDLATPSYLAGLDWSDLIAQASYYGYGFKWIFFIFFKMTDNPYVIYRCIGFLYALLFSVCAGYFFRRFHVYWEEKFDVYIILILGASLCSFEGVILGSEYSLILATFVLLFMTDSLLNSKTRGRMRWWSALIAIWLCYFITLHERSLAVIIAFVLAVAVDFIYAKKMAVALEVFVPVLGVAYFFEEKFTDYVVDFFWSQSLETGKLTNTSVLSEDPLWAIRSLSNIRIFLECVFSNLYTLIINTYGLFLLVLLIAVLAMVEFFRRKKMLREFYEKNRFIILSLMVSFFAVMITIVGLALRWGRPVMLGRLKGYRGHMYYRYYIAWVFMILPLVVALWTRIKDKIHVNIKAAAMIVYLVLGGVFCGYIYPKITFAQSKTSDNLYVSRPLLSFDFVRDKVWGAWFSFVLVGILLYLLLWGVHRVWMYYAVFMLMMTVSLALGGKVELSLKVESFADSVYEVVQTMEDKVDIPKDVYIVSSGDRDVWILQYILCRYRVHNSMPDETAQEAVVITNSSSSDAAYELISRGYRFWNLGKSLYFWVKGDRLQADMDPYLEKYKEKYTNIGEYNLIYSKLAREVGGRRYQTETGNCATGIVRGPADGVYAIQVNMRTNVREAFGSADVLADGVKVAECELVPDENGRVSVDLNAKLLSCSFLNVEVNVNRGVWVRDMNIAWNLEEQYTIIGHGMDEELEELRICMSRIDREKPIRVSSYCNIWTLSSDVSYLQDKLANENIELWDYMNLKQLMESEERDCFLLMKNNYTDKYVFDVSEKYSVLYMTDHFVLMVYRNDENTAKILHAGIGPYNNGGKVNAVFFDPEHTQVPTVRLPAGIYEVNVTQNIRDKGNYDILQINRKSDYISTTVLQVEENEQSAAARVRFVADGSTTFAFLWELHGNPETDTHLATIEKVGELQKGDCINFASAGDNQYTTSLLHAAAEWGTWTSAKVTNYEWLVDCDGDATLTMTMKSVAGQKAEIYVDGELVQTFTVSDTFRDYKVEIPARYTEDGTLAVTIKSASLYPVPAGMVVENDPYNFARVGLAFSKFTLE